jgi:4-alpha-glucanotransferase
VAEDLGVITDKVKALIQLTGLPSMAVLHFAFGEDASNPYLLHNCRRNTVMYSGTHDNDTTLGWYQQLEESTQDHLRRYLSVSGNYISWDLVRAAIQSTANMMIVPLQDLMNLGTEARFNTPGTSTGNWQWRYLSEQMDVLQNESAAYLKDLLELYGRHQQAPTKNADMSS